MKKSIFSLLMAGLIGSASVQAGTILVGTDAGLAPFEFKDPQTEEIVGFDMDIIKAVAKAVGDEAKIQNMQFAGIIPALQTNMIDVAVAAITITEERKKQVDFTDPYYIGGSVIVVRKDNTAIRGCINRACVHILENTAVFKDDEKGQEAFRAFIRSLSFVRADA